MASRKHRMSLEHRNGVTVVDLGTMEIWDGADMALLRETLQRLIQAERRRAVGVNMRSVKYIPSGFFGMLYDWHERGVGVYLYQPQDNVARMLWFQKFFRPVGDGCFALYDAPQSPVVDDEAAPWSAEDAWILELSSSHLTGGRE